jgi:hypothetical protein
MPEFAQRYQEIHTENPEQHHEELDERLKDIQLLFLDRQLNNARIVREDLSFQDALEKYTSFYYSLKRKYQEIHPGISNETLKSLLNDTTAELESIYNSHNENWVEEMREYIKNILRTALSAEESETSENKIGLLKYEEPSPTPAFKAMGLQQYDEVIQVHIEEKYKHPDSKFNSRELAKSMQVLAKKIIVEYPQTKAVTGWSWLMDSVMGSKLGFHTFLAKMQYGMSFWMQFVDTKGQINQERLQKFFNTGVPDYRVKGGWIPTEEFLELYLPEEKRGQEIVLKDIVPESLEQKKLIESEQKNFSEQLPNAIHGDIDLLIDNYPHLKKALQQANILDSLTQELQQLKTSGQSLESSSQLRKLKQEFQQFLLSQDYYTERIIIIPHKENSYED